MDCEKISKGPSSVRRSLKRPFGCKVVTLFKIPSGDFLDQSLEALKLDGRIVSITKRQPSFSSDIHFAYVFVEPNAVQLKHIQELTDDGKIKLPVSETYVLDNAGKALQKVESLHTRGKLIITP